MSELLLELFSEEIPSRMQKNASTGYQEIFSRYFLEQKISFDTIRVFVGPRRVAIYVTGLPSYVESKLIEVKGPSTNAPDNAIKGFCKSNKIDRKDLIVKDINKVEYFFFENVVPKRYVKDILKQDISGLISLYVWPKSMYWGNYKIKWVRPLINIMCIFDGISLEFDYGHLKSNNKTYGHRFMKPYWFNVSSFEQYKETLTEHFVILDQEDRRNYIEQEFIRISSEMDLVIKDDADLLEELVGLAEYPQVLVGRINEKFLSVPSEILISSMKTHQKYFSLFDKDRKFAPYFLFVSNIVSKEQSLVIQGNEKVLSARLSDALYFYQQDLKSSLKIMSDKLDKVIFHAKLGTLKEKTFRISRIVEFLKPSNKDLIDAALVCKGDILSEVVSEFPELQGVMGYYYAKADSLSENIAIAIRDHYKPQGYADSVPTGNAAILALSDKVDSLCGLMAAGEKASGSKDPYALRRQALGIIRIILGNNLEIDIKKLIQFVINIYEIKPDSNIQNVILEFFEDRLKQFFKENYSNNVVVAVLDLRQEPNLVQMHEKIKSLENFLSTKDGEDLLTAYKRASNILLDSKLEYSVLPNLFKSDEEKFLYNCIEESSVKIKRAISDNNYQESLKILASMKQPISKFFDNVMVKVDDKEVANNRLGLLYLVKDIFNHIANFDKL